MAHTDWLELRWSPGVVALTYVLAAFCSLCAVSVIEQERWRIDSGQKMKNKRPSLVLVALYLGTGIFCTHYAGMFSARLRRDETDSDIPVQYDLATVIGTFLAAVIISYCAVLVASEDVFYTKTKAERLAVVRQEVTRTSSLSDLHRDGKNIVFKFVLTHKPKRMVFGGILVGVGMAVTRYSALMSLRQPAVAVFNWWMALVTLAIAIVLSIVAIYIVFRVLMWKPKLQSVRMLSAVVMGLAMAGMHYAGTMTVRFRYDQDAEDAYEDWPKFEVEYSDILTLAGFVFFVGAMGMYTHLMEMRIGALNPLDKRTPRSLQTESIQIPVNRPSMDEHIVLSAPPALQGGSEDIEANSSLNRHSAEDSIGSLNAVQTPFRRRSRPMSSHSERERRGHRSVASRSEIDLEMLDMDDSDAPTLLFALSNSQARGKFNSFAANERSTENVKFLVAYRDIIMFLERNDLNTDMHIKTCMSLVQNIYRMFVVKNAPLEVNISSRIRKAVSDMFNEQLPSSSSTSQGAVSKDECLNLVACIESAYKEVLELVLADIWPRFKLTADYVAVERLMEAVAADATPTTTRSHRLMSSRSSHGSISASAAQIRLDMPEPL